MTIKENDKKELATKMFSPWRCGGMDYFEGQPIYNFNGYLVPAELIFGLDAREISAIVEKWKQETNPKRYKIGSCIGTDGKKYRCWVEDEDSE